MFYFQNSGRFSSYTQKQQQTVFEILRIATNLDFFLNREVLLA